METTYSIVETGRYGKNVYVCHRNDTENGTIEEVRALYAAKAQDFEARGYEVSEVTDFGFVAKLGTKCSGQGQDLHRFVTHCSYLDSYFNN